MLWGGGGGPIPGERHGERALLDGFRDQLDAGKPVLVSTRSRRMPDEELPDGVVPGHAYEVPKVADGKIHMRNPWGMEHPDPMDAKTFWEYYRRLNPDGTRDGHYTTLKRGIMADHMPSTIEIFGGIPGRLGGRAFIGGYSCCDDRGRLELEITVDDDAGERDIRCHEGDTFEFAGATWQVTKISGVYAEGRRHVATISRIE